MAAVTFCSDFGAWKNKVCHCFHFSPHLFAMKGWDWFPWSDLFEWNRGQNANICWIIEKAREFQEKTKKQKTTLIIDRFSDYEAFDCVDHNKLWKILKEMGIPEHLTYLLRNLYADQEATVGTRHGIMNWFKMGIIVCLGCTLLPCIFNLYAVYVVGKCRAGWSSSWNQDF